MMIMRVNESDLDQAFEDETYVLPWVDVYKYFRLLYDLDLWPQY